MNKKISEVDVSDWPAFCQRVSEQQSGAIVKVESIKPDGVKDHSIASATFSSMVFDGTGACSNVITLRVRNSREFVHEILDPIHIWLHPSEGVGDFSQLEIKAESGLTTITFHPGIHAQSLAGFRIS